jgi:hypothetical protein
MERRVNAFNERVSANDEGTNGEFSRIVGAFALKGTVSGLYATDESHRTYDEDAQNETRYKYFDLFVPDTEIKEEDFWRDTKAGDITNVINRNRRRTRNVL